MNKTLSQLAVAAALMLPASAASASEQLILKTDQTQVMNMADAPGTVVIGNPSIADITIEGKQVFLHGRGFGTTNMIIFDQKGGVAYDFLVTVMDGAENDVTMIKAGNLYSYVCLPKCEGTLHVGDAQAWFSSVMGQQGAKAAIATGQQASNGSGGGTTPPPPAQ